MTPTARVTRMRWHWGVLAWALWALAMLGFATVPWFDHLLRQAGRPDLVQLSAGGVPYVLAILSAATMGAVLASRRPRHPVGWLLLALGLAVMVSGVTDGYARYGLLRRPSTLPAARWVAVYSPATLYLGSSASASCCCSPRAGRCPHPAGAGGPGWRQPHRLGSSWRSRSGPDW